MEMGSLYFLLSCNLVHSYFVDRLVTFIPTDICQQDDDRRPIGYNFSSLQGQQPRASTSNQKHCNIKRWKM